jgi:hypothetical protein
MFLLELAQRFHGMEEVIGSPDSDRDDILHFKKAASC